MCFGWQVLLDPPLTDKLAYKRDGGDEAEGTSFGVLGQPCHDLTQVLIGRAENIPDYGRPRALANETPRALARGADAARGAGAAADDVDDAASAPSSGSSVGGRSARSSVTLEGDGASELLRMNLSSLGKVKAAPRRPPRRKPPYTFEYRNVGHANWDF